MAFLIVAGAVVVGTDTVIVIGAEFSGDPRESYGSLDMIDAALKFFLVSCR